MRELRRGLRAHVTADSRIATVGAGSTSSVIQVGAGEAAAWAKGDIAHFTGSGAAAGNQGLVRTITAVDTGLDTLTVEALPAAPVATDQVKGGCREWLRYLSASQPGIYEFGWDPSPTYELLQASPLDRRVVVMYGDPITKPDGFQRRETRWDWRSYGLDIEYLEGFIQRLDQLLNYRPSTVTVAGHLLEELTIESLEFPLRDDQLRAYHSVLTAVTVPGI